MKKGAEDRDRPTSKRGNYCRDISMVSRRIIPGPQGKGTGLMIADILSGDQGIGEVLFDQFLGR